MLKVSEVSKFYGYFRAPDLLPLSNAVSGRRAAGW